MSDKKYVVPDSGLKAFMEGVVAETHLGLMWDKGALLKMLKAFIRWQSENPIVPNDEQIEEMKTKLGTVHPHWSNIVAEWQRRMYLAPEPEVPDEIKDMLCDLEHFQGIAYSTTRSDFNAKILEAYRRGQKSAVKV